MHGTRQGEYRVRIKEKITLEAKNLEDRLNSILTIGENSPVRGQGQREAKVKRQSLRSPQCRDRGRQAVKTQGVLLSEDEDMTAKEAGRRKYFRKAVLSKRVSDAPESEENKKACKMFMQLRVWVALQGLSYVSKDTSSCRG